MKKLLIGLTLLASMVSFAGDNIHFNFCGCDFVQQRGAVTLIKAEGSRMTVDGSETIKLYEGRIQAEVDLLEDIVKEEMCEDILETYIESNICPE
ncbi:MAG: hypothetical protein HON90_01550 [Halobacteriovoraceae bacterium]|jgi:hypothetical protein|nr:hypothetical protein [Halobacteriovoraceae bacterium]